jgi:hypothetical protein
LENWRSEIQRLFADQARRVELGKQAREAVKDYTWLARAEKILDEFMKVV